ncbi:hypothetical protein SBI67_08420 [Mycolicibacterium sp. 120266]|uniref:hypothetical protein n=1 Tax=Mycolicibacterium sp. 120266 TaxID=3090601 RepID=UPI00299F38B6|nr:hypothetical protein [Mycolicibacterium sp. 120266]MDX1872141.1 hypothetical protein [Mycolicibacterium sp. 120266]
MEPYLPLHKWAAVLLLIVSLVAGCGSQNWLRHYGFGSSDSFYDDFTTKPDGSLTAGALSDSGHSYSVLGQIPWQISGGRLTHTQTNPSATQSSYLGVKLGTTVGYMWAEYEVPPGPHPQEAIVLVISATEFTAAGYQFANAALHCVFSSSAFACDSLTALHPGLKRSRVVHGTYGALAPGVHRAEISIKGDKAVITTPDGKRWESEASASISAGTGPWATLQLNNPASQSPLKELRVLRWGAELQR